MPITDNRWPVTIDDVTPADNAPAIYSARWIDRGDTMSADVVPDRQGFAYNDHNDRDALIGLLTNARAANIATNVEHETTAELARSNEWRLVIRRSGGYFYVIAWTMPLAPIRITLDEVN